MDTETTHQELLIFFKALADANRLKIVGLLAQQPMTVEALSAALGLGASTTSHHLSKLSQASLVSAQADGHYYIYSLNTEILQEMAARLLATEGLPKLSEDADPTAFDRKVLNNFIDPQGRIKAFPAQEKKYLVLLRYVAQAFKPGQRYTEKQVNEILAQYNQDTADLRRGLISYGFMARQDDGREYWKKEQ